ncbi:hypothetical protein PTKIN_Ptkin12aG0039300 [Pterospermum kingtungense]
MPQTTNSDHDQPPLSRFQAASSSQASMEASRNRSNQLATIPSTNPSLLAESQQLDSDDEEEKKEEGKERKMKERKEKKKCKKKKKKKHHKDSSMATSSLKQSSLGVFCMVISIALFFYI